jgi:hypothetical protein
MVLNEKLGARPRAGLVKRTILYVLGFGLGSLAFAGCLSFAMMSIADAALPSKDAKAAGTTAPKIIGTPKGGDKEGKTKLAPKAPSKARRGRGNESPGAGKKGAGQPL